MDAATFVIAYNIFLFIAAIAVAFIFAFTWRDRHITGSIPLLTMIAGEIIWMLFYAFQLSGFIHPVSEPYFWGKMIFLGIVMVPGSFLVWSASYTHRDGWITPLTIMLLLIEPVVLNLVIWTDHWHGWFSGSYKTTGQLGVAFWIHTLYSYIILFTGSIMQIINFIQLRQVSTIYRIQAFLVVMTLPISLAANVITVAFLKQLKLDFSPVGFFVVGIIICYVQMRHRFFNILPVARHKVMDEILDGVVVLDNEDKIIDMNPAARKMLGTDMKVSHGKAAETVIPVWNELIGNPSQQENRSVDFIIEGDDRRHIDLTMSVMFKQRGKPNGKLILLRDITQIKNIENTLRETNKELLYKIEENEALQVQLKEQAIRDPLTGLYNRRFLEETLNRELMLAERGQAPMSLAMIDLDRFKHINDTYGHEVGDLFLMALADLLLKETRRGDVACRFGGEEFIIVMPGAPLPAAYARINEFRKTFCAITITVGGQNISVTFSAGIAAYPFHGTDDKSIIAAADQALYAAKEAGRNQVMVAPKD